MSRFLSLLLFLSTALAPPSPVAQESTDPAVDPMVTRIYKLHAIQAGKRIGCLTPWFTIVTDLSSCADFSISMFTPDPKQFLFIGSTVARCGYQKEIREGMESVEKYKLWCFKEPKETSGMGIVNGTGASSDYKIIEVNGFSNFTTRSLDPMSGPNLPPSDQSQYSYVVYTDELSDSPGNFQIGWIPKA